MKLSRLFESNQRKLYLDIDQFCDELKYEQGSFNTLRELYVPAHGPIVVMDIAPGKNFQGQTIRKVYILIGQRAATSFSKVGSLKPEDRIHVIFMSFRGNGLPGAVNPWMSYPDTEEGYEQAIDCLKHLKDNDN